MATKYNDSLSRFLFVPCPQQLMNGSHSNPSMTYQLCSHTHHHVLLHTPPNTNCIELHPALQLPRLPPPSTTKSRSLDSLDHVIGTPTEINKLIKTTIENEESIPPDIPVKNTIGKFGLMFPTGYALNHNAAPLLLGYAEHRCPVDCGTDWSHNCIVDAITRGTHKSAYDPAAVKFLHEEMNDKISNGYAYVTTWREIKDSIPPQLTISPVAPWCHTKVNSSESFLTSLSAFGNVMAPTGTPSILRQPNLRHKSQCSSLAQPSSA